MTLSITTTCQYAECHYAHCRDLFIVVLNVVMLSVAVLRVEAPYCRFMTRLITDAALTLIGIRNHSSDYSLGGQLQKASYNHLLHN